MQVVALAGFDAAQVWAVRPFEKVDGEDPNLYSVPSVTSVR